MTGPAKAQALWITAAGHAALREAVLPPLPPGWVRVRAVTSGISRGTESLVFRGGVPVSERTRMRAPFQDGMFDYPVKYGYAMVGEIIDGPVDRVGETVFCLHPHQDLFDVPADAALTLPAGVSPACAALAPQIETALNASWDAAIGIGDTIAVVGAGVIGCLVGYLCAKLPGGEVILIDHNASRAAIATRLGCRFQQPGTPPSEECDVVFHASGSGAGLDHALACAGFEARIIELSWYGDRSVTIGLGAGFHSRRLAIIASQVGHIAPSHRARWTHERRLRLALALCADPLLDVLVADATPFADSAAHYGTILSDPATLCHRFLYRGD
ncbi:zinc-binding alcohol dehydrogenase [Acidiphilium acidophilum]|uniref:zinc-dependent alcohol dehydrogenase n=1 Tax=Acidiphilium acidophilum TaxID=76588 RepID=UPI002E8E7A35|nr:zinc-binding alcohol dehydrogenase [Acidiphilium acidophilum]